MSIHRSAVLVGMGMAILVFATAMTAAENRESDSARPVPSQEPQLVVSPPTYFEAPGVRKGRAHAMHLLRAARRFCQGEARIPTSLDELRNRGYLFYEPEAVTDVTWRTITDGISIEVTYESPDVSGNYEKSSSHLYAPGTRTYEKVEEGLRRSTWMLVLHHQRDFGEFAGITQQDIESGRFIIDNFREYLPYAKDSREYAQILWAKALVELLHDFAREFSSRYHRFPSSASELDAWIGERIPQGWVAPMNGREVELADTYDGTNAAYELQEKNGSAMYEITVPLFGAGSRTPERRFDVREVLDTRFQPGHCFRTSWK